MRDPDGRELGCNPGFLGVRFSSRILEWVGVHQENSITVNWILDCGVAGGVEAHGFLSLPILSLFPIDVSVACNSSKVNGSVRLWDGELSSTELEPGYPNWQRRQS